MISPSLRLIWRLPLVLAFFSLVVPLQMISHFLNLPTRHVFPIAFYRFFMRVADIHLHLHGPIPQKGTLILSNHASWLDIVLIGSVVPVHFVAKADVAHWPLLGMLAKIARTIFIERARRSDTLNQRNAMQKRLADGDRVVLFPEGSTSDGTIVQPFKSALLSAAESKVKGKAVKVQAMTVVFSKLCDIPMGRRMRVEYAWIGHLNLISHMLKILCGDKLGVDIVFYAQTNLDAEGGRKELAIKAHRQVQDGLAAFATRHNTASFNWEKTTQKTTQMNHNLDMPSHRQEHKNAEKLKIE